MTLPTDNASHFAEGVQASSAQDEPSLTSLKRERDEALALLAERTDDRALIYARLSARAQAAEQALASLRNEVLEKVGPFAELVVTRGDAARIWQEDRDHWVAHDHVWGRQVTVGMIRALSTLYEKVKGEPE